MPDKNKQVEVNSLKDGVYVMASGDWIKLKTPDSGFGETKITWKDNRIINAVPSEIITLKKTKYVTTDERRTLTRSIIKFLLMSFSIGG